MDMLFEIIGGLFGELYVEMAMSLIPSKRLKKGTELFLKILCGAVFICTFLLIAIGASILIEPSGASDSRNGTIMVAVGAAVVVLHIAAYIINVCVKRRRTKELKSVICKNVHVVIDRKLGTAHPVFPETIYEVNYGYIPGVTGGDGEEQDAYVLGVDEPLDEFDGIVIAVIHRFDDNETKWVVAPPKSKIGVKTIRKKTYFAERYFNSEIIR